MQAPQDTHSGPGVTRTHPHLQRPSNSSPISPVEQQPGNPSAASLPHTHQRKRQRTDMANPHSSVAQFTFAPATQQTTVTTTTTTTISLEPFVLRPPHDLAERDPKQYPLAFSQTPAAMKRIGFEVGGMKASFKEADDADNFLRKYERQQQIMDASNGSITRQKSQDEYHDTPSRRSRLIGRRTGIGGDYVQAGFRRAASPPSLAEAARLANLERNQKKPKLLMSGRDLLDQSHDASSSRDLMMVDDDVTSVTPDADVPQTRSYGLEGSSRPPKHSRLDDISGMRNRRRISPPQASENAAFGRRQARSEVMETLQDPGTLAAATPPIMESDVESEVPMMPRFEERRVPPPGLLSSSQLDASLPSPSLSPVTAAANLARSRALDRNQHDNADDGSEVSGLDIDDEPPRKMAPPLFDQQAQNQKEVSIYKGTRAEADRSSSRTLMEVPDMIDMFDALPEKLQSYVIFHMLKRCSRRTLQTVADVVNPALKCDPFDVLPVELSLKITKNLDGKSLCRAAQVSKRWRYLINSDETAWRDLIDRDGFVLADGEIERAVKEGWGWQYAGPEGAEASLLQKRGSRSGPSRADVDTPRVEYMSDVDETSSASRTRLKRKAGHQSGSHKKKRKVSSHEDLLWMYELERAQGPIGYASAAAKAVPNPNVGLPSLASMHLFKSIYQRHQMIRNTWMTPSSEPHHLAFRAHHRHVVTCLLFDSDRIITGSDDTSINVYDTKTGVLRKKLEGHEGGVWALSCDGDTLVSGSTDRSVRVWNIKTGECVQTFQGHTSTVRCLVILQPTVVGKEADGSPIIHPEEPVIITGSRDSTLRVWKLPKPEDASLHQAGPPANDRDNPFALRTLTGHHNSVRAIAAHGDTLVSGSYDCTVRVWKISTGDQVHRLQGHAQKVYSVVLDHERGRCISGSMDNLVKVWSLDTGVCLFNLEGHTSLVGLLDLSHGNLVSAAADSTLRIWDPENGLCRSTLSAHTGAITCFQHDGQKVISGSDRTLKMWNIETGDCVRDLLTDLSGVWQVRFDERRCVAAVQRNNLTYIEVLDFGASRDGIPGADRGRRIVVDAKGREIQDDESVAEVAAAPAVPAA